MPAIQRKWIGEYRRYSQRLAEPAVLAELGVQFKKMYTLPELLEWLHRKVKWSKGNITRYRDPIKILEYGKGKCGEFGILFTALCLVHHYRARLILDMSDHVWTEVWNE
ncbi:MAG: transglutaminase domain-containing protein, partial [Candidatus Bathyarchaeota archaeon]